MKAHQGRLNTEEKNLLRVCDKVVGRSINTRFPIYHFLVAITLVSFECSAVRFIHTQIALFCRVAILSVFSYHVHALANYVKFIIKNKTFMTRLGM